MGAGGGQKPSFSFFTHLQTTFGATKMAAWAAAAACMFSTDAQR